jgi:hypothetical protein
MLQQARTFTSLISTAAPPIAPTNTRSESDETPDSTL